MLTKDEKIKTDPKNGKTLKSCSSTVSLKKKECGQESEKKTTPSIATSCSTPSNSKTVSKSSSSNQISKEQKGTVTKKNHSSSKTQITIKHDAGFPNQLFIRGSGANLSWDKGELLKNTKSDEWIWEIDSPFTNCEFKILVNDQIYENGDNHRINSGETVEIKPCFN